MKPRILLAGNKKLSYYADAVTAAGGIADAKYLPETDVSYDGLILCGGNDIDPSYYGEEMDGSVKIDKPRDEAEFALMKAYVEAGKPILGICRGHQLINVFFGGNLDQDMDCAKEHSSYSDFDLIHPVVAKEGSLAEVLYGTRFTVNSYHHQGVKRLGEGLEITVTSENGNVVEGIAHKTLPILGVQWHPERMCCTKAREDTVDGIPLFAAFVERCKRGTDDLSFSFF